MHKLSLLLYYTHSPISEEPWIVVTIQFWTYLKKDIAYNENETMHSY